ncbi:MAG TPA: hypothetical protein DEF79_06665 [Gammaproteobacteria bacterium]|nr:hypothetical protein [Gammaproteobacteria bacterium]
MMSPNPLSNSNQQNHGKFAFATFLTMLTALVASQSASEDRWFQIEASIFTNESRLGRDAETWDLKTSELKFPTNIRRLEKIQNSLLIESFLTLNDDSNINTALPDEESSPRQRMLSMGPVPEAKSREFRLFDLSREEYIDLPASFSDFSQTNRVLKQSPGHNILFHGHWRQRVVSFDEATSIYIQGSHDIDPNQELIGSLTIRFNAQEDRVVVDTNLWLIEATSVSEQRNEWVLPTPPETLLGSTDVAKQLESRFDGMFRIYPMRQSREMRSNEFHYLDHPALGLIITVRPYSPPIDLHNPRNI